MQRKFLVQRQKQNLMQRCDIIEQKLRWQDADDKQASAIYHKKLNKGYDYNGANCPAGPLRSCRYQVWFD